MKSHHLFLMAISILMASSWFITGCKYDVVEPGYYTTTFVEPVNKPKITSIDPLLVVPGVNLITITGENFNFVPDLNIFLDNSQVKGFQPVIVEKTATKIVIRRPTLIGDSCLIKLNPDSGLVVKSAIFKVDPVIEPYGSFLDNIALTSESIDNSGNLYVTYGDLAAAKVYKVTPDGQKNLLGNSTRLPSDAVLNPNGWLYMMSTNRSIERMNTITGEVTQWHRLRSNKPLKYGDFDANGYFYTGGSRSDLWVIAPDSSSEDRLDLYGNADDILAIHVYNNYLYIASRNLTAGTPPAIWRHLIGEGGTLGAKELVFDTAPTRFSTVLISDFSLAADGRIFITTNGTDPFLVFDPSNNQADNFYLGIVPSFCKRISWGDGTFVFIISGNTSTDAALAKNWTIYRVNLGTSKAPYSGG